MAVPHRKRIFRPQEKMELRNWRVFRVHQLHIKLGLHGKPLVGQQTWSSFEKTLYLHFILFSQNHSILVSFLQVIVKNDYLVRWRRLRVILTGIGLLFKEIHDKTFQNNPFDNFEVAKLRVSVRISQ